MLTIQCPDCGKKVNLPETRPDHVWIWSGSFAPIDHLKVIQCKCGEKVIYLAKNPKLKRQ